MNVPSILHRYYSVCLALLAFVLLAPITLPSQPLDNRNAGQVYILAFPDTTTTSNALKVTPPDTMADKIYVYIYSFSDNNRMTVTGNGYNRVLTANSGKFEVLELTDSTFPAPQPVVTETGKISKNTFRLEAQNPVVVYCYMVTKYGSEAWTPISVEHWGHEYYAAAIPGEVVYDMLQSGQYITRGKMAPAEIVVIASENNTLVTFTPTGTLRDSARIDTVRLNRNEAFQIQSHVDTALSTTRDQQPDIAGTHITSTKPIGVLSGNTRGMVFNDVAGLAKNSFKDMMMEWVAPVEQYGTQFVYMPTMDARRPTGAAGENLNEKRTSELVRIYGPKKTKAYILDPVSGAPFYYGVDSVRHFTELRIGVPEAHYFRSDSAAQAFMNTTAVVKFLGTTSSGGNIGARYDGWGTYMVEMVPREQWGYISPYIAPAYPSQMEHMLNIVTDTASANKIYWGPVGQMPTNPVLLNKRIVGTDLVWGSLSVPAGQDLWIVGRNAANNTLDANAKFYGFVYGLSKGHEEYVPGGAYVESIGVTYAYPLAPFRFTVIPGDSLRIDTVKSCGILSVNIQAVNSSPVGLRSVSLDSVTNAKIKFIEPANSAEIIGKAAITFEVMPIYPKRDASGIVVIRDRANGEWRFSYNYEYDFVDVTPSGPAVVDFGQLTLNEDSPIQEITVRNPLSRDVTIQSLSWVDGTQQFKIVEPAIPPSITLKHGDSVKIKVQITPTVQNKLYVDSLKIRLTCSEAAVKVTAETVSACIYVGDLNFGTVPPDSLVTLPLQICNNGRGYITFSNSSGLDVATWLGKDFSISDTDKARLASTVLGPKGTASLDTPACVTINVSFRSSIPGSYRTTGRFWASTRECRDTSIWIANVLVPSSVDNAAGVSTGLTRIDPNPLQGTTRIEFSLADAAHATVEVFDVTGHRVAMLMDGAMQSGSHAVTWNAAAMPAGVYYCRLTADGATTTRTIVVVR